jgi:hypothetical protein
LETSLVRILRYLFLAEIRRSADPGSILDFKR